RRRHTRFDCDWSSDVCSSDLSVRCALEILDLISDVYMLERSSHPSAHRRLESVTDACPVIDVSDPIELLADRFFAAMHSMTTSRSEERRVGKEWWCRVGGEGG